MAKRKLFSPVPGDRVFFWYFSSLTLIGWGVASAQYLTGNYAPWYYWTALVFAGPAVLVALYFLQRAPKDMDDPYAKVIIGIAEISRQLSGFAEFLKQEQIKVAESEATLKRLQDEKTQLEPVVSTYREVVNAILAAHAKTTASNAWKERALGFISGVLTSLLASLIFELFRQSKF